MVLANFYCDTPVPPKWVNKIDHIPDYKLMTLLSDFENNCDIYTIQYTVY